MSVLIDFYVEVVLSTDLLEQLATRVVVPLVLAEEMEKVVKNLNPKFTGNKVLKTLESRILRMTRITLI